jgi:para-nitrobenzyl esterase
LSTALAAAGLAGAPAAAQPVRTDAGLVEGTVGSDPHVRAYRGIPFAAPPVGDLRWKAPQPVTPWSGVRKAAGFGPRCMQGSIFGDMIFRDPIGEDCLYLNVWTPAASVKARLPVMVWIYGGGFQAGSTSEPRQDGERLAAKGVVVVSMSYRLGVFGFFAHPELSRESGHGASGNQGLLDQIAALQWVKKNISAFGGDPGKVTIFGESAGSFAVSALMASPLSQGLFSRALGESGAFFTAGSQPIAPSPLSTSEEQGTKFTAGLGADSLAAARARPAEEVLKAALSEPGLRFRPNLDGYALPKEPREIFAEGAQSHVPLLAGWNADESRGGVVLAKEKVTARSFAEQAQARYGDSAGDLLKAYPATSDAEALESAASLASDLFIGYATWKWIEAHGATGQAAIYRYSFDRKRPIAPDTMVNGQPATARDIGARHAGEIEYVFGTLDSVPKVTWEPSDRKLSDLMMNYWTNFARTGNPNGPGLPKWPAYDKASGHAVLHLDETTGAAPEANRARYEFLDAYTAKTRSRVALWNGRDITGWTVFLGDGSVSPGSVWSANGGVLRLDTKANGYLKTGKSFANYHLHVEWRWPKDAAPNSNSGVMVHVQGQDSIWPSCFEAQLRTGNAGQVVGMGLDIPAAPVVNNRKRAPRLAEPSEAPLGEWNRYEIYSRGETIEVFVNGVRQNYVEKLPAASGAIALQMEGFPIEFREVWLEPL